MRSLSTNVFSSVALIEELFCSSHLRFHEQIGTSTLTSGIVCKNCFGRLRNYSSRYLWAISHKCLILSFPSTVSKTWEVATAFASSKLGSLVIYRTSRSTNLIFFACSWQVWCCFTTMEKPCNYFRIHNDKKIYGNGFDVRFWGLHYVLHCPAGSGVGTHDRMLTNSPTEVFLCTFSTPPKQVGWMNWGYFILQSVLSSSRKCNNGA